MGFGITGQSSHSSTSQSASNNSDSNNQTDSNNQQVTSNGGPLIQGKDVTYTVNAVDGGLIDSAGQIAGKSLDAIRSTTESAFGFVGRVIESAFGQGQKNQEIIAGVAHDSIDQVATANGNPTVGVWQRNGLWIVGGVLAVAALWIIFGRKGRA